MRPCGSAGPAQWGSDQMVIERDSHLFCIKAAFSLENGSSMSGVSKRNAEHRVPTPTGVEEQKLCFVKSEPLTQLVCSSPGYSCWLIHPPPCNTRGRKRGPRVEWELVLHPRRGRSFIFKSLKQRTKRGGTISKAVDSEGDSDQPLWSLLEL